MTVAWLAVREQSHRRRQKYGQTMTLTRTTGGTYNPATGGDTGEDTTEYPVIGHSVEIEAEDVDGTLVQREDKMAELSAQSMAEHGITPTDDDQLTIGGVLHEIVTLETIAPGGVAIRYDAVVRAT